MPESTGPAQRARTTHELLIARLAETKQNLIEAYAQNPKSDAEWEKIMADVARQAAIEMAQEDSEAGGEQAGGDLGYARVGLPDSAQRASASGDGRYWRLHTAACPQLRRQAPNLGDAQGLRPAMASRLRAIDALTTYLRGAVECRVCEPGGALAADSWLGGFYRQQAADEWQRRDNAVPPLSAANVRETVRRKLAIDWGPVGGGGFGQTYGRGVEVGEVCLGMMRRAAPSGWNIGRIPAARLVPLESGLAAHGLVTRRVEALPDGSAYLVVRHRTRAERRAHAAVKSVPQGAPGGDGGV